MSIKHLSASLSFLLGSIVVVGQLPSVNWGHGFQVVVKDIATDAVGNSYVLGEFMGTVDFNPGPGVDIKSSASNTWDICVIKFNVDGEYVWGAQFGGSGGGQTLGDDQGIKIGLDNSGNVYFGGYYMGIDIDFDPSGNVFSIQGGGVIVTKLNNNGMLIWARQLQMDIPYSCILRDIAIDSNGNTVCSVDMGFTSSLDMDPTQGELIVSNAGSYNLLLWRLNSQGNYTWHKILAGGSGSHASVSMDESGSVYVAAGFVGPINVGTVASPVNLFSFGARDILLCKYSTSGALTWAHTISGLTATAFASAWSIDSRGGQVVIGGQFTESFDFDPGLNSAPESALGVNNIDGYISVYSAFNGQYIRSQKLGDIIGYDAVQRVRFDALGNVYAVGVLRGVVDFDSGPDLAELNAGLNQAHYVAKWGELGNHNWVFAHFTQSLIHTVLSIGSANELFLGGSYSGGQVDIDPSSGVFLLGGTAGWFAKYNQSISTGEFPAERPGEKEELVVIHHMDGHMVVKLPEERAGGVLTVYDATGRMVRERRVDPSTEIVLVDMVGQSAGIYVFRWNSSSGEVISLKALYF